VDENFQRASIAHATKPYKQTVIVPDTGKCEPFKINLKVSEKVKAVLLRAVEAHGGRGGIAPTHS
jgi:hypothetical protein